MFPLVFNYYIWPICCNLSVYVYCLIPQHCDIFIIIITITIIIIIIIYTITFKQDIYNYTSETHHVSRVCSVAALLYLQFVQQVILLRR